MLLAEIKRQVEDFHSLRVWPSGHISVVCYHPKYGYWGSTASREVWLTVLTPELAELAFATIREKNK